VHGGSRQHTKIGTEGIGTRGVIPVGDAGDEAGAFGQCAEGREGQPAIERREGKVDDHRVDRLVSGSGAVAGSDELHAVDALVADDEHTRDHCRPPP
jgi:hypothetical protein